MGVGGRVTGLDAARADANSGRDASQLDRHETKKLPNGRIVWKYDPNVTQGLGPVDLWKYIKLVKAPTLYMVGANSNLVPRETQEQLKALPHIEVVTIPDAGHLHLDTLVVTP